MESSTNLSKKQLDEAVGQLSSENQSHLLGVLEALHFVQNERESRCGKESGTTAEADTGSLFLTCANSVLQ